MTVLFIILISLTAAFSQDWPQWRGINRDGKVTGFAAPGTWPKELIMKWKVTVGLGDATPALVAEKLYIFTRQGNEEVTLCLDAADGKELWRDKYEAQAVTGAPARHPGSRSSPAVSDGKVVTLGAAGILSCLDAANGKVVWRRAEFPGVVPKFFTGMSPVIVDGMVIAHLGGENDGAVIAYDLVTGFEKWRWAGDGPAYASPVLMTAGGTRQVVVQTEKNLLGIALKDGKLLWQIPTVPVQRFYNSATPVVDGQVVIYTGQGNGTRAVKIAKKGSAFAASEIWKNETLGTGYNTPVLKDGFLYGMSEKGYFFSMNAKTGETAWSDTTKNQNFGAVIDAGSVLIALPSNSDLYAFKPESKKFIQLACIKVSDTPVYAHPVIAGKRIYIKDQDTLTLWTVE